MGIAKGKVTEDGPQLGDSGNLNVKDVDTGEAVFQAPSSLLGAYGNFTFDSATGAWTYTLANDAANVQALNDKVTVQDSLTVFSSDGTASETITVDITGANDAATITASSSEDTAVKEDGGVANATAGDALAGGTLTVHDVDSGEDHFAVPASLAGTYGNFTFNAMTGVWGYTLDQGKADPLAANQPATDALMAAATATGEAPVPVTWMVRVLEAEAK